MKNKKLKEYKELKHLLGEKKYKEYPLDLVLGSYLAMMTWKPSIKLFFQYIFFSMKRFSMPSSKNIICTYSTQREDYIDLIKEYLPNYDPIFVRVENTIQDYIYGFLPSFKIFFRSLIFIKKIKSSLKQRFILTIAVSIAFKVIDEIEKHEIESEIYIAFNSSYLIESFISWYFRNRGVKTHSLQHGMYYRYTTDVPFDVINYENVCAENLLVWGDYTKNQISKLIPETSSCIVYGYPSNKFPKCLPQFSSEKILVILPRDIYLDSIFSLLNFLGDYDLQFLVRPHPSVRDDLKDYIRAKENFEFDDNKLLGKTLNTHKFFAVVGFNSTAIFEAALNNQKVLLFATGDDEFLNPGFNQFTLESNFIHELEKDVINLNEIFFSKVKKDFLCL